MNHIRLLQYLVDRYNYRRYLEIGCGNDACFSKIDADEKIGVEPAGTGGKYQMSSDQFFQIADNEDFENFHLIFIDGLHHADQVYRDIQNALAHLKIGGTIVVHDLLPENELEQRVPREVKTWTGDGWKAWLKLRQEIDFMYMFVIDSDHGIGVIQDGRNEKLDHTPPIDEMDYQYFLDNKDNMNIVNPSEIKKHILYECY